jgi:hypothetical protein
MPFLRGSVIRATKNGKMFKNNRKMRKYEVSAIPNDPADTSNAPEAMPNELADRPSDPEV